MCSLFCITISKYASPNIRVLIVTSCKGLRGRSASDVKVSTFDLRFMMRISLWRDCFQVQGTLILRDPRRHTDSKERFFENERLIAYRPPRAIMRTVRYLEKQRPKQVDKALKKVWYQRFDTHDKAVSVILDALDSAEEPI